MANNCYNYCSEYAFNKIVLTCQLQPNIKIHHLNIKNYFITNLVSGISEKVLTVHITALTETWTNLDNKD